MVRCSRDDLEGVLLDCTVPEISYEGVTVGVLTLDPNADPPFDRWQALMENRKFALSWQMKRRDLPDQSASGYDLSLASLMVMDGWNDQQIVSTLICFRRRHGLDLKLRVDYYQRTIARARRELSHETAVNELETIMAGEKTAEDSSGDARAQFLTLLREALKVNIQQVIKYANRDGTSEYELVLEDVSIRVGQVTTLLEHQRLKAKIAEASGKVIPNYKGERWRIVAQALLSIVEVRELGDSTTEQADLESWLRGYLTGTEPAAPKNPQAMERRVPVLIDGRVYFYLDQFQGWLSRARGVHLSTKELGVRLRRCNCPPEVVRHVRPDGTETTRELWPAPPLR